MATPNTPYSDPLTITTPTTRRFPAPCWTNEETVSLIQSYRDKWYSLRRGNLKAHHWQEVADSVFATCHSDNPPKTSIQCRHKMEKLRKRYRAECLRIANVPKSHRYLSTSWLHFKQMDYMELGLEFDNSNDDNDDDDVDIINVNANANELFYPVGNNNNNRTHNYNAFVGGGNVNGNTSNGVRIRLPSTVPAVSTPIPTPFYNMNGNVSGSGNRLLDDYPPPLKVNYGSVGMKRKVGDEEDEDEGRDVNVVGEMVAAINKLGDGFVKMERMKMDMAREIQSMRMKMDMRRTQMIIESQQKLVDAFLLERKNKKVKRMPTPES